MSEILLTALEREAWLGGLRIYASYSDPNHPSNVRLSPEAASSLIDTKFVSAVGHEALEFIESLQSPTNVGVLPMLAEVLSFVGMYLFDSPAHFKWFTSLIEVTQDMMPSVVAEFQPGTSDQDIAVAKSNALRSALDRVLEKEVKVADIRHLIELANHAEIMRFNPEAVKRELERLSTKDPSYTSHRKELIKLVHSDLAGLKSAEEINRAARSLAERVSVERRR